MMSHAEFKMFVNQPLRNLYLVLSRMKGQEVLRLLRELQMGLAGYSKAYTLDQETQMKALSMLARVERTARKEFIRYRRAEILRERPELRLPERAQSLKEIINVEWGRVYGANAY